MKIIDPGDSNFIIIAISIINGLLTIIKIDENKCDGCGNCVPNCKEGALQIIDGKARLISDLFCDGLGACLGHCPQGAITLEKREAIAYDEKQTMIDNIIPAGNNTIKAHLEHLKEHNQKELLQEALEVLKEKKIENPLEGLEEIKMEKSACGCPGAAIREVNNNDSAENNQEQSSALRQWPVQLNLLPVNAPFFENSHLLVAADCVPFANPKTYDKVI